MPFTSACRCCGIGIFEAHPGMGEPPDLCHLCEVRGGLCLHNMNSHLGRWHSTRPHWTDEFADDPEHCPPCLEARGAAAWVRGAGVLRAAAPAP